MKKRIKRCFLTNVFVDQIKVKITIIIMISLVRPTFYFSATVRLFVFAGQGTQ